MTNQTPVVSVRGIYKSFGGINVLKNVDLDIRPGEVHGLLGENGAGKSTLAKIIAGVHQPNAGKITVMGKTQAIPNVHRQ
jgi:ABC-type sugar transport system ATPase subunit